MNIRLCGIFMIAVLISNASDAQKVRTIEASQQEWSGGVAGRSGQNYNITLVFAGFKENPVPDTLWIEDQCMPLSLRDSTYPYGNTKRTFSKDGARFQISVGTERDENEEQRLPPNLQKKKQVMPPVRYGGVALVSYKYKGKERYYEVTKITKVFPPIAYP